MMRTVYGDPDRFRKGYWEHIPPRMVSTSILPEMGLVGMKTAIFGLWGGWTMLSMFLGIVWALWK